MSLEHTTRAITENKYSMQLFADKESLKADIATMEKLKASNPSDERVSDYTISQKKYELSQIENRIKGKDYSSVKSQCEQYFTDNSTLFDRNQIIAETRSMLSRGQTVNEWPHLAAVFLLDHASVTDKAKQDLAAVIPPKQDPAPPGSLSPGEHLVKPGKQSTKPVAALSAKPQTVTVPVVQPKPENAPEILTIQQKIVFKDGAYYLTGPKGNARRVEVSELLVNLNLPKNAPENLKKSVKMIEDFSLLLDAYIAANPKETAKHEAAIKQIQGLFAHEDIQMGKKILDVTSITSGMFGNFWRTFSDTDLKKVNDAFRIQDESARRLALLNFIRDDLGQSDIVLGKIMEQNSSYFAFPSDENILTNGDLSAAGLSVAGRQSVEKVIRKAYLEAAGNWNKNYKEYIAQFKAQNPGAQVNEGEARKMNERLTVLALAKREIMYQKLYNKDLKGELALAQDIMGAADFDMSDKSWDVSKEIGGMIAMEAIAIAAGVVTAGAATVAINAAMLGRSAYRGAKALEAYNAASNTKKALTTSARILGSGAGFEAGAATTRSYIENGDFTSMHSLEGYTQSIAMMGVIGGIGKLITAGKFGKGIQFQEGAGFAKNTIPFVGQVAIEGTAIFGTSAAIGSVLFDRRDNWTLEQMAQAMLMAALLKGAGRLTASKNPKGEIEVKQTTTEKAATPTKKDVIISEGTFKSDSKVDLASFTTREITATDVRRAKVLINNGEYPQFIAQDGTIWSIRSVTGRSGKEVVEIGPLGQPSLDRRATIQEFVEGVNANVRKFKPEAIKPAETAFDLASFTTREITATDVRRAKVLINNGEYPQFIAQDGTIWSIRSVTGRSGKEMVEIGPLGQPSLDRRATIQEFVEGVNANVRKFKVDPPKATETSTPTMPETPVQKSTEAPAQKSTEAPAQKSTEAPVQRYSQEVEKSLKGLHKNGDSFVLGKYTVTKEGKTYRIKGPDGEFVGKTQKDVVSNIEKYLQQDAKVANDFISSQVKTHIDNLPTGKKVQYGEATVTKNKNGNIEVVGKDGKVLSGEDLSAFYQKNAEGLLNTRMKSFLSKHGDEKVDPNKFAEWYGKERSWYNPIGWGKGVINMTWNEIMQPVQTWNAFLGKGGALRTLDNPLAMTNNIAKAIVLRDVKMNWLSTDSAMRVIGRGTIMTGATAAAANDIFGDNLPAQLASIPMIFGYSTVSGDTSHTSDEVKKTAYSTYYAGMLWGNLLSQMIGGMPNN